jgi:hypothetical protein
MQFVLPDYPTYQELAESDRSPVVGQFELVQVCVTAEDRDIASAASCTSWWERSERKASRGRDCT